MTLFTFACSFPLKKNKLKKTQYKQHLVHVLPAYNLVSCIGFITLKIQNNYYDNQNSIHVTSRKTINSISYQVPFKVDIQFHFKMHIATNNFNNTVRFVQFSNDL